MSDAGTAIVQRLLARVRAQFPEVPRNEWPEAGVVVRFPAPNPAIGAMWVEEDGDWLIVNLGEFAHRHFDDVDDGPGWMDELVDEVVCFLADVFADRIETFGDEGGGGIRLRDRNPPLPDPYFAHLPRHVWSGLLGNDPSAV